MSALDDLIAAVEAGDMTRAQSSTVWKGYEWVFDARVSFVEGAFHGSLDAAKALHEALLPGWIFDVTNDSAFVQRPDAWDWGFDAPLQYQADGPPARAWLLSILKALKAKGDA